MAGNSGSPVSAAVHAIMKALRDSHEHHRTTVHGQYNPDVAPAAGTQSAAPLRNTPGATP